MEQVSCTLKAANADEKYVHNDYKQPVIYYTPFDHEFQRSVNGEEACNQSSLFSEENFEANSSSTNMAVTNCYIKFTNGYVTG